MGLQKRYPPEPEPAKQNEPAPKAQSGPAQGDKDVLPPEKELTADQKALVELTPEEQKNLCLSALAGSMEKLPKDDPDIRNAPSSPTPSKTAGSLTTYRSSGISIPCARTIT